MKPLRIALISRRFWPLVGGAEIVVGNLAVEFQRRGAQAVIVTAQWEPSWPAELVHREVRVVRLPNPRQRGWGTFRYMLSLRRWLREHRDQLDVAYVSMLKHDAYSAVKALRGSGCAVVLRAEGAGETGDCHWQRIGRFGLRIRRQCRDADALVAPSPKIAEEMLEAGYPPERTHIIPNGVPVPPVVDAERRMLARAALVEANWDLNVPRNGQVAVYTGRLHEAKGLLELVDAWAHVVKQHPDARLWLIGEGPLRDVLHQRIRDRDLHNAVFLPGVFDDITELLYAAHLFVLPSYEEGMSLSLLEAMSVGLPCVASDIPGNRLIVGSSDAGWLVPPRDVRALSDAILQVLADPRGAAQTGVRGRELVAERFSLENSVQQHLDLFQQVLQTRRSASSSSD